MEVRWRLFARDVLSMTLDDDGGFMFGRPPRPVRGLRVLGVVVHRSSSRSLLDLDKGAAGRTGGDRGGGGSGGGDGGGGGGGASDGGDGMHDEYGSLAIGEWGGMINMNSRYVVVCGVAVAGTFWPGDGSANSTTGRQATARSKHGASEVPLVGNRGRTLEHQPKTTASSSNLPVPGKITCCTLSLYWYVIDSSEQCGMIHTRYLVPGTR